MVLEGSEIEVGEVFGEEVLEDRQRDAVRPAQSPDVDDRAPGRHAEGVSDLLVRRRDLGGEDVGLRLLARALQVLEQTREFDVARDLAVDDLGADATPTDEEALVHEFLDGSTDGRAGEPEAIAQCPETWRILQKIPGMKSAMFSIFEPGKHLPPHRGPYNGVLRFHLGLVVPDQPDKIGIRIDKEVCHWKEGEALIFDDAYEHEAWNHSDSVRVVLFVDFEKPLTFPANLTNKAVLNLAVFTPFIREGYKAHKAWEKIFYGAGQKHR